MSAGEISLLLPDADVETWPVLGALVAPLSHETALFVGSLRSTLLALGIPDAVSCQCCRLAAMSRASISTA